MVKMGDFGIGRLFANDAGDFEAIDFGMARSSRTRSGLDFLTVLEVALMPSEASQQTPGRIEIQGGNEPAAHDSVIIRYENTIRLGKWQVLWSCGSPWKAEVKSRNGT